MDGSPTHLIAKLSKYHLGVTDSDYYFRQVFSVRDSLGKYDSYFRVLQTTSNAIVLNAFAIELLKTKPKVIYERNNAAQSVLFVRHTVFLGSVVTPTF